ncbi:GIY-YIG nuclease family protein [Blastococcus xanthinilyticus]|uniref:T5orf172 domain-containing protein n=1 Tax=Blastococcus xanthinilyticus TaxID=1564164 RepID=A0A5S5CLR3_9ACTN|nr:GIY-YIG nuclease family protein [Blastococcus xanthinilyticus]TYP82060.1 T5orf172 domain-containing protein [Blastococcus xanthinilyticus]
MTRRTIRRSVDRKSDRLNRQTPNVTECAWPGCHDDLKPFVHRATGAVFRIRIGPLCLSHADAVADAVLEDRLLEADFRHHELNHPALDAAQREREQRSRVASRHAADERFRGDQPGFVYFIEVGERVKIGYSVDVRRRLRSYPPGSVLLAVEPGSPELERQRHQQFAGSLLDGREWFRPDRVILEQAAAIRERRGDPARFAHRYRSKRGTMQKLRR